MQDQNQGTAYDLIVVGAGTAGLPLMWPSLECVPEMESPLELP